jgi:hypothetical protein
MKKVMALLFGAFLSSLFCCNDNTSEEEGLYGLDEPMPPELLEMLDSLPIVHIELGDVILPNGLAVRDFKKSYPDLYKTSASPRPGPVDDKCGIIMKLMGLSRTRFFQIYR